MTRSEKDFLSLAVCLVLAISLCDKAFAQNGQMDREMEQLYEGTNINPFDAGASNNLALKLFRQGQYERALKLLQRAQRLAPDRIHIKQNAQYLQLLMAQVRNLDLETANSLSRTYEREEIPYVPEPWGSWNNRLGAVAEADIGAPVVDEGVSTNPFDADSLIIIAGIKSDRGDLRGALSDLRRAQRISPWISGLKNQIARLQAQLPDSDMADSVDIDSFSSIPQTTFVPDAEPPKAWEIDDEPLRYLE